jgi:hypothetical protein
MTKKKDNSWRYTNIIPLKDAMFEYTRSYSNWGSDYSVTGLIRPPRELQLVKRHQKEIDAQPFTHEKIVNSLKSFKGTAIHNHFEYMLRRHINKNRDGDYLIEQRVWDRVYGRKISGKIDAWYNKVLYDWKTTSVWKRIFGDWTDFEKQLNLYAYLLGVCNVEVQRLVIIAWFLDWDKNKLWSDPEYPKNEIEQMEVPLWDTDEQGQFLYERIEAMKKNEALPDDELEFCSEKETWAKPMVYAVMRPGQKRAVAAKGLTTKEKAEQYIKDSTAEDKDTFTVECRPGARTKCEEFCQAAPFCNQFKQWKASQ